MLLTFIKRLCALQQSSKHHISSKMYLLTYILNHRSSNLIDTKPLKAELAILNQKIIEKEEVSQV
jgi:hypothetical protein